MSKRPAANQAKPAPHGKSFAAQGKAGWWRWRKAWCAIIALAMAAGACSQEAPLPATLGNAILCLDDLAPGYFYNAMGQHPYKIENGAYWFKTSAQLLGVPLTEVFISDGSSRYDFVGAVSSLSPVELAEAVSANVPAGGSFQRLNRTDRYSIFVSRIGSEIAYHGKKGKIFCRRDRIEPAN